jgi:hypothetical protein
MRKKLAVSLLALLMVLVGAVGAWAATKRTYTYRGKTSQTQPVMLKIGYSPAYKQTWVMYMSFGYEGCGGSYTSAVNGGAKVSKTAKSTAEPAATWRCGSSTDAYPVGMRRRKPGRKRRGPGVSSTTNPPEPRKIRHAPATTPSTGLPPGAVEALIIGDGVSAIALFCDSGSSDTCKAQYL